MNDAERHPAVLERDEVVLIVTRRIFAGDARRHFVGSVERCDWNAIRVRGYAFVYDVEKGGFARRKSQRTRIFPLDNQIIVFVLPYDTDLSAVHYETTKETGLVVTDGKHFKLEINEFNA